ncbi:MAG: TetR/AcrR family transcriptional regulator [Bacteroidales bacterium]
MESQEELILRSARSVFLRKGLDGARMQEIADEAGINKALLHYYFRNKEKLFQAVFNRVLNEFLPALWENFQSDVSLEQKIRSFVEIYFRLLSQNIFIPQFIISELNRDPQGLKTFVDRLSDEVLKPSFSKLEAQIREEIRRKAIRPIDPYNLMVNIISMCIFPFLARPVLSQLLFEGKQEAYESFLEERKKHIPDFIMNSIRIQDI